MSAAVLSFLVCFGVCQSSFAALLDLPERGSSASGGREFAARVAGLSLEARDQVVFSEIMSGNIPRFLRRLCPVRMTEQMDGTEHSLLIQVTADYLAVGSDTDYILMPMKPGTAQAVAERLDCSLPTPRLVTRIYESAAVKLVPQPLKPGPDMITVPVFSNHNELVWRRRTGLLPAHPLGTLTAGHKKDVVISARCANAPGKVAIFGWHRANGTPIQPLYLGHTEAHVDYSHGVRLVANEVVLDGVRTNLQALLSDPRLCQLVSDEGPLRSRSYAPVGVPATNSTRRNR